MTEVELTHAHDALPHSKQAPPERAGGKLKYKSALDRREVAGYLEAILTGVRSGDLGLSQGSSVLRMHPGEHFELRLEARQKGGSSKLQIELTWDTPAASELPASD